MSGDGYELYYWPGSFVGPGRAEFVRLLFIEAGVPFKHISEGIMEMFKQADQKWTGYPTLAVPLLKKGSFELSQTPVICRYLGKQFGLYPDNEEDQWHAEQINATVHDYIAEGRLSFHGINPVGSYFGQEKETQPYIDRFLAERLPKYMKHFEKILAANDGGKGYVVGGKVTFADLGLLHVLRATAAQFPEAWAAVDYAPLVKAFKDRMEARPNLAAYFKSDKCIPFSGNSMM
ncbi:glutathione S-transferase P 1-like [Haliotis rubra]|uniref:glutathione S-transferase P 1-like n=1 Tax=Haliotis rubra TaxID=36100 RepID=UPI001EE54D1D|nr:glutathione S-transferase P 1-like [Haliotis rubra]XP_046580443.1 glutathione S-transferase P 1-like [Haliotis rubra]